MSGRRAVRDAGGGSLTNQLQASPTGVIGCRGSSGSIGSILERDCGIPQRALTEMNGPGKPMRPEIVVKDSRLVVVGGWPIPGAIRWIRSDPLHPLSPLVRGASPPWVASIGGIRRIRSPVAGARDR